MAHRPPPWNLRVALSTAAAAARLLHQTGLYRAFPPRALARFALDLVQHPGRRGGAALVHLHALADPHRPAIVDGDLRLSYGELDARTNRLAHGLRRLGVAPGDRVATLLPNSHAYIELNAACSYLGAYNVQVGYRLKPQEVAYILHNAGAKVFVFHHRYGDTAEAALTEAGTLPRDHALAVGGHPGFADYEELLDGGDPTAPPALRDGGTGGLMIYTSGTTGKPKGARRSLKDNHLETVVNFMAELPILRDERHLVVCPLYHSAGAAFVLLVVALGGCVVLVDHFEPEETLRTIERERITSSMMVPTHYHRLLELGLPALRRHDFSSLRWLMSGAAPLPTELARRIEDAFGPVLYNFYGATETGFVTLAKPGEHTARPGTIGRLVVGNDIRLLDAEGRDVPGGQVGELYVTSRMLMEGYHADVEATQRAQRDGYISVGDLAWRDADGYYYLADRKIDMVISGGVNIYPIEIEQRLHEHPAVGEAAVVGVPDPAWGESLVAFVVPRRGVPPLSDPGGPGASVTEAELQAFVTAKLADYKKPRRILFRAELPRTPTGKVLKRELRAELAAAAAPPPVEGATPA
jgi:fatty-acyl-CoA synthase